MKNNSLKDAITKLKEELREPQWNLSQDSIDLIELILDEINWEPKFLAFLEQRWKKIS